MKIKSTLLSLSLIGVFLLNSCEKNELASPEVPDEPLIKTGYYVQNGILVFGTTDDFLKLSNELSNYSEEERNEWEKTIGFLSQRRIYSQVIEAEQKHIEPFMNMTDDEIAALDNVPEIHSDVFKMYLQKGVIKLINGGTEDENWDLSVFDKYLTSYLNQEGLFAIGDSIFQATDKSFKILNNLDFSKIETLKSTIASHGNIEVHARDNSLKATPVFYKSRTSTLGDKRVQLDVSANFMYFIVSSKSFNFTYEFFVRCQEKKWYGWRDVNTNTYIYGDWDLVINPAMYSFQNTFYYNYNMCNLRQSINPYTGIRSGSGTIYSIKIPQYDGMNGIPYMYFDHIKWRALRAGGCCGFDVIVEQ